MKKDPFEEYIRQSEPDKRRKSYVWSTAIGLQDVDDLKPSDYLYETAVQNIEGKITIEEAGRMIDRYYEENPRSSGENRTEEADPRVRRGKYEDNGGIFHQIPETAGI